MYWHCIVVNTHDTCNCGIVTIVFESIELTLCTTVLILMLILLLILFIVQCSLNVMSTWRQHVLLYMYM